jgi:hypothetical protein
LHWLTGRRTRSDNWDAFEAPDGQPLLVALRDGAPQWSTLKSWLLDLSAELVAAAADDSMPVLRLDRLWLRDDGRLLLLDFAAPRSGSGPARSQVTARRLTQAGLQCSSYHWSHNAACHQPTVGRD